MAEYFGVWEFGVLTIGMNTYGRDIQTKIGRVTERSDFTALTSGATGAQREPLNLERNWKN